MNVSDIFKKLVTGTSRDLKSVTDYEITINDDLEKFYVVLRYSIRKSWWLQAVRDINKKLIKKIDFSDDFHADARFHSVLMGKIRNTLKEVQRQVREDRKYFQMVTYTIDDIHFVTEGEKVNTKIRVSGACHG